MPKPWLGILLTLVCVGQQLLATGNSCCHHHHHAIQSSPCCDHHDQHPPLNESEHNHDSAPPHLCSAEHGFYLLPTLVWPVPPSPHALHVINHNLTPLAQRAADHLTTSPIPFRAPRDSALALRAHFVSFLL